MKRIIKAALPALFASQVAWSFDFNSFNDLLRVSKCARSVSGDIDCKNMPEEPIEGLFPTSERSDVEALDPSLNFIWGSADRLDLTIDLSQIYKFNAECKLIRGGPVAGINGGGGVWPQRHTELRSEDLNGDEYSDYLVNINCSHDIYHPSYDGPIYGEGRPLPDPISEPYIFMICGSSQGFYNCTEELTGIPEIINMAPERQPGKGAIDSIILWDINGDGVKDMVWAQTNDLTSHGWDNGPDGVGLEWYQAYYDVWGMTRQEVIDLCNIKGDLAPDVDNCWFQRSEQTYAISSPEGWQVKTFPSSWATQGGGGTELYLSNGIYYVNFDMWGGGDRNWYEFDPDSQEFIHIPKEFPEPVDRTKDWNNKLIAMSKARGSDTTVTDRSWHKVDDFEIKVTELDHSFTVFNRDIPDHCSGANLPGEILDDNIQGFFKGDYYDTCDLDQLHIIKRNSDGTVEKIAEHRTMELVEDIRPTYKLEYQDGEFIRKPFAYSKLLHGHWITSFDNHVSVAGKITQLETRPDAPWFLIVTYEAHIDGRYATSAYNPDLIDRCKEFEYDIKGIVDFDDPACNMEVAHTSFKYEIDLVNNELIYAGTLLEHPYYLPRGEHNDGGNTRFIDLNNDGWMDIKYKYGYRISDPDGNLLVPDMELVTPLMEHGRNTTGASHSGFTSGDVSYSFPFLHDLDLDDVDNDGITDYVVHFLGADTKGPVLGNGQGTNQKFRDNYDADTYYMEIIYGEYSIWDYVPLLDSDALVDRIEKCMERGRTGIRYGAAACISGGDLISDQRGGQPLHN